MNKLLKEITKYCKNLSIHQAGMTAITLLISSAVFPCGNEYGHKLDGTKMHSQYFYLRPYNLKFDTVKLRKQIADYDSKYSITDSATYPIKSLEKDKALSNKALALMKLDKVSKAKDILVDLVLRNPKEYSMVANLGTAYELSGELDSALKYISKGLEINPKSHYGSEWIHVELLKAKIKRKRSKYYIIKNPILSDELLESKRDTSKRYWRRSRVLNHIYWQVRTRAPFTPAPNEVIWNLLLTAGEFAQKHDTYENALLAFAYSRKYAYNYEQKRKSEQKIKALNKLRDKLPHDKMVDRMFFHTIKRADISPDFLLMGLDELSESLDSVNTLENKYLSRIDSLETELKKPKPQPVAPKKVVKKIKKEQSSNRLFYIIITSLVLTTVFFAIRSRRKG